MVRLRNALMIGAMAAGAFGCAHGDGTHRLPQWGYWSWVHCSECDDFPQPLYGPNQSMMPGSYSGPPPQSNSGSSRMGTPTSSNAQPLNNEAAATPPDERPVPPAPVPPDMPSTPPSTPPAANP